MSAFKKFSMLVLLDHTHHGPENSGYPLIQHLRQHPHCEKIDIATRGNGENTAFFDQMPSSLVDVRPANENFIYTPEATFFTTATQSIDLASYDVVWLRIPPPVNDQFLNFLITQYPDQLFINDPRAISEVGSKAFLRHFPQLCPPIKLCTSVEDILTFNQQFPIVLKPLHEYGGKGIVKISSNTVYDGYSQRSLTDYLESLKNTNIEVLAMKYLKYVTEGDKRIVIIDGHILGATLRMPAPDSWICNVSMGGTSVDYFVDVTEEEREMVKQLHRPLTDRGILMYGIDTLLGDDGKRKLSEINVASFGGGLPSINALTQRNVLQEASEYIWNYVEQKSTSLSSHD